MYSPPFWLAMNQSLIEAKYIIFPKSMIDDCEKKLDFYLSAFGILGLE